MLERRHPVCVALARPPPPAVSLSLWNPDSSAVSTRLPRLPDWAPPLPSFAKAAPPLASQADWPCLYRFSPESLGDGVAVAERGRVDGCMLSITARFCESHPRQRAES